MPKIFEKIGLRRPKYSGFDLSHERKMSMNMGRLVPCYLDEVLPGDQFSVRSETLLRFAPLIAPVMHRVDVTIHYFFVPTRLLWNQWEAFITGGRDGTSTPTMPTVAIQQTPYYAGCLADYMGIPRPPDPELVINVSQLPFRAYYKIINDYYRDPNLTPEIDVEDLADYSGDYQYDVYARGWEKDYFTSCLPWPQRGPEVSLPVEVNYSDVSMAYHGAGAAPADNAELETQGTGMVIDGLTPGAGGIQLQNIEDDAINVSINELRTSSAIQRWLEKQARGGARLKETILSQFGVMTSDARLQRAEYLGGGRQPVVISEVLNTTGTESAPQGNMAGHGYSAGVTNSFKRRFEEHGYVFGIMSVMPKTAYQQGVHRMFYRTDKFDYAWPEFANLGEQPVLQREIMAGYGPTEDTTTFGYQQRYAEYKYGCSTVHGAFRDTLAFWHMGRIFDSPPLLNDEFTTCYDPATRIFAAEETDQYLWVQVYNSVRARRPLPYFSDPRLM